MVSARHVAFATPRNHENGLGLAIMPVWPHVRQRPEITWCFEPACQYGPDGRHAPEIVAAPQREHAWQIVVKQCRPPRVGATHFRLLRDRRV